MADQFTEEFADSDVEEDNLSGVGPKVKIGEKEKKEILQAVKLNRALWDSESPDFNNKNKRHDILLSIAKKYGTTVENMKKVLHSMITSMKREVKRSMENEKYHSKWPLYNYMEFMKDEIRKSMDNNKEELKWKDEEIETLIDFYKEHPLLWNPNLRDYSNRDLRKIALEKLSKELGGKEEGELKKQWHILRVQFNKNVLRHEGSKKSGTDTDNVFIPSWKFYESMLFMKESLELDVSTSTLSDDGQPNSKRKVKVAKTSSIDCDGMNKAKLEMYHAAIQALQTPPATSQPTTVARDVEIDAFGKLVMETLSKFNDYQRVVAKKKINDVLFEIEIGNGSPSLPVSSGYAYQLHTPLPGISFPSTSSIGPHSFHQQPSITSIGPRPLEQQPSPSSIGSSSLQQQASFTSIGPSTLRQSSQSSVNAYIDSELVQKYGKGEIFEKECSDCGYKVEIQSAGTHFSESGCTKVFADDDEFHCPKCLYAD